MMCEVGAREQQHAAGDDGSADEHFAFGGAAQQGGVGKRHDHDRQALQKAGGGGRSEAGAQAHAGELGCHNGADDGGTDRLWKSSGQATKAMMQRSATILVAFMLSMPIFMRGYENPHATGTENESAIAFLRSMGLLLLQNGFVNRILLSDVDVVKRMYLQYD